ncbi:MAG: RNA-binding protein [Clostridiales bacterium GWF2_38_85]|nr:MAG: RNA-binding protein [Clostridiales bacterium GWF2_38_85]HBL83733.1 RNA-binding protein [Clostridiales bacterium]
MKKSFGPEGALIGTYSNNEYLSGIEKLEQALRDEVILEARTTLCDSEQNLYVELGQYTGIIPKSESLYSNDGSIKDIAILTRVGKPVCFKVTDIINDEYGSKKIILSRKAAQRDCIHNYIEKLIPGDIIPARVTHLENFGAFVDIGCGIISMLPIDCISISRISHPHDRFDLGQYIKVIVKTAIDEYGRITLTHKELLGTWEENAVLFTQGVTVAGIVRSIESYGVFVELTPNLAGLAEYREGVEIGNHIAVYIKSILSDKMKIKLVIVDSGRPEKVSFNIKYFIDSGHIDYWRYSPDVCERVIETVFL